LSSKDTVVFWSMEELTEFIETEKRNRFPPAASFRKVPDDSSITSLAEAETALREMGFSITALPGYSGFEVHAPDNQRVGTVYSDRRNHIVAQAGPNRKFFLTIHRQLDVFSTRSQ
jgi:hypothetical protein